MGSLMGSMTSVRSDPSLAAVADDTGGSYFELSRAENLRRDLCTGRRRAAPPMPLGFEANMDDKMRKLEVRIKRNG